MNTLHMVETNYLTDPGVTPQNIFALFLSHQAAEDYRGYLALMAYTLNDLITSDWQPSLEFLESLSYEEKRRAGYLMEFAWRKMIQNTDKKAWLMETALLIKKKVEGSPSTTLFPPSEFFTPAHSGRLRDELAADWGLLDGVTRSDILKMLDL